MVDIERPAAASSGVAPAWRRALPYMGPAFVACVAYVDPGNFATNFAAGAYGYTLLWVILLANAIAMVVQNLSAKLGIVTGRDLAATCRSELPRPAVVLLWMQAEAVAAATDLAEIVGGAIALYLLFGIPLPVGGPMTAGVAFTLLGLEGRRHRQFEAVILGLLGVIGAGFCYNLVVSGVDGGGAARGVIPTFAGPETVLLATGILGATVMPHAIYVHSALTSGKHAAASAEDAAAPGHMRSAVLTQRYEVLLAMGAAGLVNAGMLFVAAELMAQSGAAGLGDLVFVHERLGVAFGGGAALAFALALLASGLAASSIGTYAGQVIMQGFLRRRIPLGLRRLVTLAPAVLLLLMGVAPTTALVWSQVVLSFGIPFALLPLLRFTSSRRIMGEHVNRRSTTVLAALAAVVVIGLNAKLVVDLL